MDAGRSLATDIEKILFGMTVGSCQNLSLNPPTQYICQENIFAKGWRPKEKTSELKAKSWQKLRAKNFGFGRKLCKSYQTYAICRDIKICCNLRNFRKTLGKRSTFGLIFSRQMRHYARNRKFANLIQYNMQIYHVVVHFLPKKHCFWPKKALFLPKNIQKVRISRQIVISRQSRWVQTFRRRPFVPSHNFCHPVTWYILHFILNQICKFAFVAKIATNTRMTSMCC